MGDWAWQASDLATGLTLGQLAMASWTHEDRLNTAGRFNAKLIWRGAVLDRFAIDSTLAGRSLITPFRNGRPLGYAGINWTPDPPRLAGAGLFSYFDAQTYDTSTIFNDVDQHTIARTLVDWVQANGGNIRVDTTNIALSGTLRDQTWDVWEQKKVGEAIRQKADNIGGYDFDVRIELDELGEPVRRMRMWTPRRGRIFQAGSSPVFTVGRNARNVPAAPADATKMATHVIAVGWEINSTTHERLIARSVRTDLLAAGYPRLTIPLDLNDVKDLPTLQQHADGYAYRFGAVALDELVLDVNPDDITWPWGSWDLGDDCQVVIPVGLDSAWPTGLNATRRVVAHRWSKTASEERFQVVTGRTLQ